MSLLSSATLNVPIEVTKATNTEESCDQIFGILKLILKNTFKRATLTDLAQFLLPRKVNILSLYATGITHII